ncbi:MAG: DinB family protein [Planctomycetes bacterium]|nr:DinB family protein [Planctomycetota bacterium]
MSPQNLVNWLERFATTLPAVLHGVSEADLRWKPPEGTWSILEVLRHLLDEEVNDFRVRVGSTLRDPTDAWPPIDPEGWAVERKYNEADPAETLARFVAERRCSVDWLHRPAAPDWTQAYEHPQLGSIHAGDLLAAWAAHDMLHLRQIAKRIFQIVQRDAGPYQTDYAGEWRA